MKKKWSVEEKRAIFDGRAILLPEERLHPVPGLVSDEVEDKETLLDLLEVVTDADYAGDRNDRRSAASFQVFIDGNLMESKVRAHEGNIPFVGGVRICGCGSRIIGWTLIKNLWEKITEEKCEMKVRSDSSAARAMVQRQGIGRVRHLDASLLWVQQKEKEKIPSVGPIPTGLNCADIGTRPDKEARDGTPLHAEDGGGERVGEEEYKELEHREQMKKGLKEVAKNKDLHIGL